MDFAELNWIAILVSAGSAFALGGLWYGPLFGKSWQRRVGLSDEALAEANMALVFGVSFLLTLVISVGLAVVIPLLFPSPGLISGLLTGIELAFVFVLTSFGINYLFARRSMALFGIDVGYLVCMFALMGAILGAWS